MNNNLKILSIIGIAGIVMFGISQAQAKSPNKDIEERVTAIEQILTPTIKDQTTEPILTSTTGIIGQQAFATLINPQDGSCTYLNIGTIPDPNLVVNGWCPSSHEPRYFISDARALSNSLIIINVQRSQDRLQTELQIPPVCIAVVSGTFTFPRTTFTGFIIECQGASPELKDKLAYTIL